MVYTMEEMANLDVDALFSKEKKCNECLERKDKCCCQDYDFIDQYPICNPFWQK